MKMNVNRGSDSVLGVLMVLLVVVSVLALTYLIFVGVAWVIIAAFGLTYNPWLVGLALWIIKLVFFK